MPPLAWQPIVPATSVATGSATEPPSTVRDIWAAVPSDAAPTSTEKIKLDDVGFGLVVRAPLRR